MLCLWDTQCNAAYVFRFRTNRNIEVERNATRTNGPISDDRFECTLTREKTKLHGTLKMSCEHINLDLAHKTSISRRTPQLLRATAPGDAMTHALYCVALPPTEINRGDITRDYLG